MKIFEQKNFFNGGIFILALVLTALLPSFKPLAQLNSLPTQLEEQYKSDLPVVSIPVTPGDTTGLLPVQSVSSVKKSKQAKSSLEAPDNPLIETSADYLRMPKSETLVFDPEFHDPIASQNLLKSTVQFSPPTLLNNFAGVGNLNGYIPPDTNGAVGRDHYVQMVNVAMAVYSKSGSLLYGPFYPNLLWPVGDPCRLMNDGDPVVLYDQLADRWLISQFGVSNSTGPYYECIAISKGAAPTNLPGDWYPYTFKVSQSNMNDYPKLAVWPDGYFMMAHEFYQASAWQGTGIWVFDRMAMLSGQAATFQYRSLFNLNPNYGGMLPASLQGQTLPPAGAPHYFVEVDQDWIGSQEILTVFEARANWPSGFNLSLADELPVAPFQWLNQFNTTMWIPQPNTNVKIDSISDRLMMHAWYRNMGDFEVLLATHTVDVGSQRAGIRWYELRKYLGAAHWSVFQQGTYAPADSIHRWLPSISMDGTGNIAMGYNASSSTTLYPGIYYTGRLAGDPPGTLPRGEGVISLGGGYQTSSYRRWGDYAAMTVDPVDDCTFWFTTEYIPVNTTYNWHTRIASFRFPECIAPPSGTLEGTLRNAATNQVIQGGQIIAQGLTSGNVYTGVMGAETYLLTLPADRYTVRAGGFGFTSVIQDSVAVGANQVTGLDFFLTPMPRVSISGTLRDEQASWPLYGLVSASKNPGDRDWTDPQTGFYSLTLPAGVPVTLTLTSFSQGYRDRLLVVGPFTHPDTLDISLKADWVTCDAPGYQLSGISPVCGPQAGGLAVGEVHDGNSNLPLIGAVLQSKLNSGHVFTASSQHTLDDLEVGEGFYVLFVPDGSGAVISASLQGYVTQTVSAQAMQQIALRQDFLLPAGRLEVEPLALTATLPYSPTTGNPAVTAMVLTLKNTGSSFLSYTMNLVDPLYRPAQLAFRRLQHEPVNERDAATSTRSLMAPVGQVSDIADLDLSHITGHACLLGVEAAHNSIWVTSGGQNSCADPNYLLRLDPTTLTLAASYPQPDNGYFGWRDLAYDGSFLYASDGADITQIDTKTGSPTGVRIPSPLSPARGLTYDPISDHFWLANWQNGLIEINRQGFIVNHWASFHSIYGLAWDSLNGAIWALSQDGTGVLATRINPLTGLAEISFSGQNEPGGLAGGASFTNLLTPGRMALLVIHQNSTTGDRGKAYDVSGFNGNENNPFGITWAALQPVSGSLDVGGTQVVTVTFTANVSSFGTYQAWVDVHTNTPYLIPPINLTLNVWPGFRSFLPVVKK